MWASLIPVFGSLIDKLLPDPQAAADAKLRMIELAQRGELEVLKADAAIASGQIGVNTADAGSSDAMQRRWRPFIGWVCGVAVAWDTIVQPMLVFGATWAGYNLPAAPHLSSEQLYGLLFGLLGLGGFRTFEKVKGVAP